MFGQQFGGLRSREGPVRLPFGHICSWLWLFLYQRRLWLCKMLHIWSSEPRFKIWVFISFRKSLVDNSIGGSSWSKACYGKTNQRQVNDCTFHISLCGSTRKWTSEGAESFCSSDVLQVKVMDTWKSFCNFENLCFFEKEIPPPSFQSIMWADTSALWRVLCHPLVTTSLGVSTQVPHSRHFTNE